MTESVGTRSQLVKIIKEIIDNGEGISISAVAHRCGVSHSLIYNRYPDLKERIKELKDQQKARQKAQDDESLISNLLAKNKVLQKKLKSDTSGQVEESFKTVLVHMQQLYSMYDQLCDDRNKLAERLAQVKTD